MLRRRAGLLICISFVALAWISVNGAAPQARFREGWMLLKPKAGQGASLGNFHAAQRVQVQDEFKNFGGLQIVRLPPGGDVLQTVGKYQKSGLVEFAEPDYMVRAAATPNESAYMNGSLWHLYNTGMSGADIHAASGWDATNVATNIIVAVVDSGIRYTHQDLAANMWVNPGEIAGNGRDDDHNRVADDIYGINAVNYPTVTGDPNDDFHHGTHVAGIIGATGNNGVGACGVAWRVKLMACKFLDTTGSGNLSAGIYCLNYAIDKGAKVINASFADTQYSSSMYTALNSCRTAGIIVVAAAGNDHVDNDVTPYYPASYNLDNIVAVAATTRYDQLADYSNYGATNVDLAAPGSAIYSTVNWSDASYDIDSGTSYAAPCVAGALALMRARWSSFTYRQIIDRLLASTDPLPSLEGRCVTGGRLNLAKALNHWPASLSIERGPSVGKVRIQVKGEPYQKYVLEGSGDFAVWTGVATNTSAVTGTLSFTNSTTGTGIYYRVLPFP